MGLGSSKQEIVNITPMDQSMIEQLCQDTGFSEEELMAWHQSFYTDCPDGKLSLRQFEHEYAKVMGKPSQKTANYIRHMFNVYDQDKNQFIDFREFVLALSAASVVNRLRLIEMLFHVFDLDNDGRITKDEISKMLQTLIDVTDTGDKRRSRRDQRSASQSLRIKQAEIQRRIDDAFDQLNTNADDHITKDEFIEWYMKSGLIADVQKSDLTSPDASRTIQTKKSRKGRKSNLNLKTTTNENESNSSNVRHMSRMIERKLPSKYEDDDDLFEDESVQPTEKNRRRNVRFSTTTDEKSSRVKPIFLRNHAVHPDKNSPFSQISNENDRWKFIFDSVFSRMNDENQSQTNEQSITTNQTTNGGPASRWKRKIGDTIEMANVQRRVNGQTNQSFFSTSETDLSNSNDEKPIEDGDIVSIRL